MSVTRTLDRLHRAVRQEARRNPAFAARLEAALGAHASRRAADPEDVAHFEAEARVEAPASAPDLNPVALLAREGEAALAQALAGLSQADLVLLVREHNLDPAGETEGLDRDALAAHVAAQARRRVERDKKLFDY